MFIYNVKVYISRPYGHPFNMCLLALILFGKFHRPENWFAF